MAAAEKGRENADLQPLLGPQDYVPVDAALPAAVNFGPAERARLAKQSIDVSDKMKTVGSGYIPKNHQTTCTPNSKGLFAYYQVAETSFILTCRTADGTGSGWAGITGIKDPSMIDAERADAGRLRQGGQEPQRQGARARPLHGDPRTSGQRPFPLADDRPLQRPVGREPLRPDLLQRQGARHDEARREGVQRVVHAARATSATRSCARARSPATAPRSPTSRGSRRACSRTWPTPGPTRAAQKKPVTPASINNSLVMEGTTSRSRT